MHTPTSLLRAVAEQFATTPAALIGRCRTDDVLDARAAVVALVPIALPYRRSLVQIGAILGGRDHTTITALRARALRRCRIDPNYRAAVTALIVDATLTR